MVTKLKLLSRLLSTTVSTTPTVHRGTAFERRAQNVLQTNLSMSLRRIGGKSDGGIDLLGWWWLPPLDASDVSVPRRRLRVLAQCKAEKKKIGPKYVREMEGVLHRYLTLSSSTHPFDTRTQNIDAQQVFKAPQYPLVALYISESPYTRSTILRAQSSPVPLFLLHLPPASESMESTTDEEHHNWTGSAVWNPALGGTRGLLGGEVDIRWERNLGGCGRPGLWWRNQKLKSWTPEVDEIEGLHLQHEDLLLEELAQETA